MLRTYKQQTNVQTNKRTYKLTTTTVRTTLTYVSIEQREGLQVLRRSVAHGAIRELFAKQNIGGPFDAHTSASELLSCKLQLTRNIVSSK